MFGALPAALTYYSWMKMPETAMFTEVEIGNEYGFFSRQFLRRHGLHLLVIASTWFLLDIAFSSQNLFQQDIFKSIGWIPPAKTMNALEEVYAIAIAETLIALSSTLPGYLFTIFLIGKVGRFAIQLIGLFFMIVFMLALAIPYNYWTHKNNIIGFFTMYSLTFFFANATTLDVLVEIFPARLSSTCHGISAAAGIAGTIVGAFGFSDAAESRDPSERDASYPAGTGVSNTLILLGCIIALGMIFPLLMPVPKGNSREGISPENVDENQDMESRPHDLGV